MDLKLKFKLIRKKEGFTQNNFAKFLSVPASSYQRYELGTSEVPSSVLFKITKLFPEYTMWLMNDDTGISAEQISPNDEKPKTKSAAIPAELLNAAFEQTLTTSIELGWVTPKEGVNFSMLSDLLRHDFVQQGGCLIEPAENDEAKTEAG